MGRDSSAKADPPGGKDRGNDSIYDNTVFYRWGSMHLKSRDFSASPFHGTRVPVSRDFGRNDIGVLRGRQSGGND